MPRLERHLGARIGHKIGGTTETMRRYLSASEPMAGEIFAHQCHPDGATVARAGFIRLGIETEIAVRLADALPPRPDAYTRADMAAAVAEVMAAIELVDDRYADFGSAGVATLIADNAFDAGSVLGAPASGWRGLDLAALTARTFHDGRLLAEGRSDALLGHPLDALAWLANCRSKLGLGLTAGQFVSLGTITPVHWVRSTGVLSDLRGGAGRGGRRGELTTDPIIKEFKHPACNPGEHRRTLISQAVEGGCHGSGVFLDVDGCAACARDRGHEAVRQLAGDFDCRSCAARTLRTACTL